MQQEFDGKGGAVQLLNGSTQSVNVLMYYTYSLKAALNLAQDDIDGISYLYPVMNSKTVSLLAAALLKIFHHQVLPV